MPLEHRRLAADDDGDLTRRGLMDPARDRRLEREHAPVGRDRRQALDRI